MARGPNTLGKYVSLFEYHEVGCDFVITVILGQTGLNT